jgi:hypothetical protein
VNCQRLAEGSETAQFCEVVQSIWVQGQQGTFARIAIGQTAPDQPLAVRVVLPDDITLPSAVHIGADAKDKGSDLNWTRCTPGGCFAKAPLSGEVLQQWRAATKTSKVSFEDAAGREIAFPVSSVCRRPSTLWPNKCAGHQSDWPSCWECPECEGLKRQTVSPGPNLMSPGRWSTSSIRCEMAPNPEFLCDDRSATDGSRRPADIMRFSTATTMAASVC